MTAAWRLLIDDGPAEGAWNMALDRAVQLSRDADKAPPTVRLYTWARPTVTLGRFQDVDGIDRELCEREGIDVARRFTGGRGVLHDDEVTYSIVAGTADGIPRGVAASYRLLCGGLVRAYELLGVQASLTARPRGSGSSAACYLHATAADVSLGALKLSGSAQVWSGGTVLQHGSFTISRDVEREGRVFRLAESDAARLADETVTLAQVLGRRPSRTEIVSAAVRGISERLGIVLELGTPSQVELRLAADLMPSVSAEVTPSRLDVRGSR